jgi:hypothetical protein
MKHALKDTLSKTIADWKTMSLRLLISAWLNQLKELNVKSWETDLFSLNSTLQQIFLLTLRVFTTEHKMDSNSLETMFLKSLVGKVTKMMVCPGHSGLPKTLGAVIGEKKDM